MSSHNGKYGAGFDNKLVRGQKSKFLEYLKLLTSVQAIKESFNCLRTNIIDPEGENVIYHYNRYGSRTNKWRDIMFEKQGAEWIDNEIASSVQMYRNIYNDTNLHLPYSNTYAYRAILQQCRENNIEFDAFVNPLYQDHFELLISSAIYPDYINFLSFLAKNGGFWYFGGINEITSDKNYFWDSQHPRKALSNILAQIMLSDEPSPYQSKLFGTFYTRKNIGELIEELELLRKELISSEF
jgi:hypothetical protein